MNILINQTILILILVMVQCLYFITPTSAMLYAFDEAPNGLFIRGYHEVWCQPPGSTVQSAKDYLESYLRRRPKDRRKENFFTIPPYFHNEIPGVDSLKLMNKMLKSEKETWPEELHKIFKTKPTYKVKNFWGFIYEISNYMSTSVLQKSFIIILKEREELLKGTNWNDCDLKMILRDVTLKYESQMKEHVKLVEEKKTNELVLDIFTRDEQEKLREYGIRLEKRWSTIEEVELYRNWASHMSVYVEAKGKNKGILETQAILVSLIKLYKRHALGVVNVSQEMSDPFWHSLKKRCESLTEELVDDVRSLDPESWLMLWIHQREYDYGIYFEDFEDPDEDTKKILLFWMKNMSFYFEIKSKKIPSSWNNLIEDMILEDNDGNQFINEMKNFSINTPSTSDPQVDLMVRFLNFVLENSKSERLKELVTKGLKAIKEAKERLITIKR
ncbi:hypothetical protein DFH28DRAFT_305461 [Melampsora americana]|nr:hypothetical protein DFH28DRAFT_305461 [Melampsora americana]